MGAFVNIGLRVGRTAEKVSAKAAKKALEKKGVKVKEWRILDSETDPTLVAEIDRPLSAKEGDSLARELKQDAIAQKYADGSGDLFGPDTESWGGFKDEYFIDIDAPGFFQEYKTSKYAPTEQRQLERFEPPKGEPQAVTEMFTPENEQRLIELFRQGKQKGGDRWYHTGGIKDAYIDELGMDEGIQSFDMTMDLNAAVSPRSAVDIELKRASIPYMSWKQGGRVDLPAEDFPKGYGHLAHKTAHLPALKRLQETGKIGNPIDQQKTVSYSENLKGNYEPGTVDTHNYQIVSGQKRSPTKAQYPYMESRQRALAEQEGVQLGEFQSGEWVGGADITGVRDPANFTEQFNRRIANTARELGVSEAEAARMFMRGKTRLYQMAPFAAAGMAGMLATGEDAEAAGLGRATSGLVKTAKSAVTKAKLGGQDSAYALDTIMNQMERVQKLGGRVASPTDKQRAMDELWRLYEAEQARAGGDLWTNVQQRGGVMTEDLADYGKNLYRKDRPFTPEEEAIASKELLLEREMRQKPEIYQGNFGDEGPYFKDPYEPKFYSQKGKHGPVEQIDPKDYKAKYGAGAAAGSLAISDSEADPGGALAGSGVADNNGRITGALEAIGDFGEGFRQFGEDMIGGVLGGASAIGTLLGGGSLEQAQKNRDFWRGGRDPVADDPSNEELGFLENWLTENPGVTEKLVPTLDFLDRATNPERQYDWAKPATYALESIFVY